jgi:hypothetical protein
MNDKTKPKSVSRRAVLKAVGGLGATFWIGVAALSASLLAPGRRGA